MASIIREITVEAAAPDCWEAIRDFGALHERLARGFASAVTMVGERDRQVTFVTGAVATERLIGIDEQSMRLAYSVIDGPVHFEHYNASAQVIPCGPQQCRFLWTIDLLPDELADRTAGLMEAGLRAIGTTLGELGPVSAAP
jgi:polyketide cyclase/dehydrase/lipid transport protein